VERRVQISHPTKPFIPTQPPTASGSPMRISLHRGPIQRLRLGFFFVGGIQELAPSGPFFFRRASTWVSAEAPASSAADNSVHATMSFPCHVHHLEMANCFLGCENGQVLVEEAWGRGGRTRESGSRSRPITPSMPTTCSPTVNSASV
jgi:hypothetical protein